MLIIRRCTRCKQSKDIREFGNKRCLSCMKSNRKYDQQPEHRISKYKREAIRRKKEYALDDEFAKTLFLSPCFYCGTFEIINGIDRRDNDVGYITTNCVSCCDSCNYGKGKKSEQDFIDMCFRVAKNLSHI